MDNDDMKFRIVYDGPALDSHEMDVRDLAPALLSLSDVFEEASKTVYGKSSKISIRVNASFKAGSFGIDLIASSSMAQHIIGFLSGDTASATTNIISLVGFGFYATKQTCKGLIQLIKWIGPRKIKEITPVQDGKVKIRIDEDVEIFDNQVLELYKNYKLRAALEEVISHPLEKDGIDSFAVTLDDGISFVEVNKAEAPLFKVNKIADKILSESVVEKALQLIDISFHEGHKWRFNDGSSTFQAEVTDEKFIKKIDEQIVNFAKADLLLVDLKTTQYLAPNGIKTFYEVIEVKKIINPQRQIDLPFE